MTDSTIHAQRAVIARFNAAAKKYLSTYADHRNDPCNGEALEAWDKATAEFSAMIANDELQERNCRFPSVCLMVKVPAC